MHVQKRNHHCGTRKFDSGKHFAPEPARHSMVQREGRNRNLARLSLDVSDVSLCERNATAEQLCNAE
jgi:hypothetical protein